MFVNGQAMRGGSLHHALSDATFLGPALTAARYRFYAFPAGFPGISPAPEGGGVQVTGEIYEMTYADLREMLLPGEPDELELSAIELADGSGCLSMVVRAGLDLTGEAVDISDLASWRAYLSRQTGQPA